VEGNTFCPTFSGYFIANSLLYNFADESFHTIKLCSKLFSIEIEFYSEKLNNRFLSHNLRDLSTPSIACWKDCGRFFLRDNWIFAVSYGCDVISGNLSKSAFFKGGGSLGGYILGWRITFRTNIYGPLDAGMVVLQFCCWKFSHKETF